MTDYFERHALNIANLINTKKSMIECTRFPYDIQIAVNAFRGGRRAVRNLWPGKTANTTCGTINPINWNRRIGKRRPQPASLHPHLAYFFIWKLKLVIYCLTTSHRRCTRQRTIRVLTSQLPALLPTSWFHVQLLVLGNSQSQLTQQKAVECP